MYRAKQFLDSFFFIILLLVMFFLLVNSKNITESYSLSPYTIPLVSMLFILYGGYRYVRSTFRTGRLEHEFTSIMNHTFRTPLTRVMWFTKELEKDMPQKDRLFIVQNIENSTAKVLDIVDLLSGIKDINDRSSYVFEAISLREVIEKSMSKYREEIGSKNITFQIPSFTDIPLLSVDLKKISFVVDTLIENAISYTPTGGKITIECISMANRMTLYVSDTGMGLSFTDKMRIFSRFYRSPRAKVTNTDGLGIRLYLSKQIIKRHGGKIYAKSKGKDMGSTFFVELPFINS